LTLRGDPYETHDPVFGVKQSLVVDLGTVEHGPIAEACDVKPGIKLLRHDFVMVGAEEAADLRRHEAKQIMGGKISFYEGMPVPDVD